MDRIKRHYLMVEGRRVHYRRLGDGPPLVMLHGSPGDSAMLSDEMRAAAPHFTCIALDTPGFGGSEPLPGDVLTVDDLARATAAAMTALGLPPCRVYGTHTGAAIGAALGAGWPDRVSGLILEGLPIFTTEEITALFGGYFAPMKTDPLGGHLTQTWVRFRDQFTWFPWLSRDVTRLNPVDRPTPEEVDHWVSMFYRSCKTYGPAYKAACYYGYGAFKAAEAIERPVIFMVSAEDMLFPHLDRLPPLKPGQRVERLAYDPPAKYEAIARFAGQLPGEASNTPSPATRLAGANPAQGMIETPGGQVFVRAYGDPTLPPVILLHDSPGTGLMSDAAARTLGDSAYVLVPDLPGVGESDPPERPDLALEAAAEAITALADALDLAPFVLAATGCGCATAALVARDSDPRLTALVLNDPLEPKTTDPDAIAPEIPLTPEGGHWLKAWLMLRDGQIYRPWFDGRVSAQRPTQGNFDADWLHDQTVALMTSRATYHWHARAAFAFDLNTALDGLAVPVRFAGDTDFAGVIVETLHHTGSRP